MKLYDVGTLIFFILACSMVAIGLSQEGCSFSAKELDVKTTSDYPQVIDQIMEDAKSEVYAHEKE